MTLGTKRVVERSNGLRPPRQLEARVHRLNERDSRPSSNSEVLIDVVPGCVITAGLPYTIRDRTYDVLHIDLIKKPSPKTLDLALVSPEDFFDLILFGYLGQNNWGKYLARCNLAPRFHNWERDA